MTEPNDPQAPKAPPPEASELPTPTIEPRKRWAPSLVWLIPLVAAVIGLSLVAKALIERGPTVVIDFKTAEGLEAGKTKVKYKEVDIGTVKNIELSDDLSHVRVTVDLTKNAKRFAVKDSRWWVVRPRVAGGSVSGLSTLLSGAYIGADAGKSRESVSHFTGLEVPPVVSSGQPGKPFVLHASDVGSLDIGSPIYYRRIQVGQVEAYSLDPDGKGVTLRIFVQAPYDQYVGSNTRFWHASGIDLRLDSSGFQVNTQSLASVVIGGIAFQAPNDAGAGVMAKAGQEFRLAPDEATAMKAPDTHPVTVVFRFQQSLRGLVVGAPVDFRGITLGEVTSIGVEFDAATKQINMPVTVMVYPDRLRRRDPKNNLPPNELASRQILNALVSRGLRGQLRTGNLLTGQLYVALDFFPNAKPAKAEEVDNVLVMPTVPNTLDQLQLQIADIASKLDKIPFDSIGQNLDASLRKLDKTLESAQGLFRQLDNEIAPEAKATLGEAKKSFGAAERTLSEDSPVQQDVRQAMQELTRTLRSLNTLADYLQQHPEALLRGKPKDPQP
ncbi:MULTISPECIES: intermembrane transport protein PqiB [Pandoraea]|jgi:paraquat-inducible protein B|uniref:Mammalian cell entry protein n=1 Tax=Pandoraea pnomenusa TaxID=93220 RepID=A0A378YWF9_9BURK|nr:MULTISPECIES: MlaD family protein [Pandoraea]AHB06747.1 mammalian cell entry protein [Pandoraea pnomenusa 3kgm]AHB77139.1 mammalian cell entry protein [Pandoraea pnomenusa]AHN74473.1 mammalian cell entry protein [Pandoraea pnomenusa]AIU28941.1 mammalian cell entry protein [Pandoraea pnomenusa]ANC45919.1 mammalian cell entry protein [Pandoraea pnomenusa]